MKRKLQLILAYLRLFWPRAFFKAVMKMETQAHNKGYLYGLEVGHRRGWMAMRAKVKNAGNKYPHEPENVAAVK